MSGTESPRRGHLIQRAHPTDKRLRPPCPQSLQLRGLYRRQGPAAHPGEPHSVREPVRNLLYVKFRSLPLPHHSHPQHPDPNQPKPTPQDDYCYNLSLKLNQLLGIGLAVEPPTFFRDRHLRTLGPTGNILRFLYYPPLSALSSSSAVASPTEEDVRAGAHSDYGSITLLFRLRGQAGLELDTSGGGTWASVPVCPPGTEADPAPPVLVNIGDLLSYWTDGLLRSTVHRVVFPPAGAAVDGEGAQEPRYSIAFFCHPVGTTSLEPVPSARVRAHRSGGDGFARGGNPDAERKAITADEHLQMRLKASYLQLYEKEDGAE